MSGSPDMSGRADAAQWLAGQTAVVTGGSSGIGRMVGRAMRAHGAHVTAVSRRPIEDPDDDEAAGWIEADVSKNDEMDAVARAVAQRAGSLDILVVNAGTNVRKPFLELSAAEIEGIVATNLVGALTTLRVFGPAITARPGGRVVVTSSVVAHHGMANRAPYNATKGGLSALTRTLAVEWGPLGTRVNAVAPGVIRTTLTDRYLRDNPGKMDAAMARTPLRRIGEPEDVADVVLFLVSPMSRFITGQVLVVDGGLTAGSDWW